MKEEFKKYSQELYDKKYLELNGERLHVTELEDRSIAPEILRLMRVNSYATEDLPSKLDNHSLIEHAEGYLSNTVQKNFPCKTYDEALVHRVLPELIKRMKEIM